ncbi:MAG: hypothetical protein ACQKBY_11390, partial [Verrucomicrobiales bacterium]
QDALLDRLGRTPRELRQPVGFQQASYANNVSAEALMPASPAQRAAAVGGLLLILGFALIFFLGTMTGSALFADVSKGQRLLLAGFVSLLGIGLVVFGAKSWRLQGSVLALLLSGGLFGLVLSREVRETPGGAAGAEMEITLSPETDAGGEETLADSMERLMEKLRLSPLDEALAGGSEAAGVYFRGIPDSHKIAVSQYLERSLKMAEEQIPTFYPRGENEELLVLAGLESDFDEVYTVVERLGELRSYPERHLLILDFDQGVFGDPDPALFRKLTDWKNPAFFKRNLDELDQVHADRVKKAVTRLAGVPSEAVLLFKPEIRAKLVELLHPELDSEMKVSIAAALKRWGAEDPDLARALGEKLQSWHQAGLSVPRELVALIVPFKEAETVALVNALWRKEPLRWRELYQELGREAEDSLLGTLEESGEASLKLEAIKILHVVGTKKSLPALEAIAQSDDEQFAIYVGNALQAIRKRAAQE